MATRKTEPTEEGLRRYPETAGYYICDDRRPACTCRPSCEIGCKGECGCEACHAAYQDFGYDEW